MFTQAQRLRIPLLADELRLGSDQFLVTDVIRGGMGVCARVKHEEPASESAVTSGAHDIDLSIASAFKGSLLPQPATVIGALSDDGSVSLGRVHRSRRVDA
jgi:hypothetical protein